MTATLSRADLLRAYLEQGDAAADALARRLGYRRVRTDGDGHGGVSLGASSAPTTTPAPQPTPAPTSFAPVPLWAVVHREWADVDTETGEQLESPPEDEKREGLRPEDLRPGNGPPPPAPPLAPWPAVRRALDDSLQTPRFRRRLDVDALVRRWSRGETVRRLPLLEGKVHARLALIVDHSPRLHPWAGDMLAVVASLVRRLGPHMLRFLPVPRFPYRTLCPHVAADEIVLVLSDLGLYGTVSDRRAWLRLGRQFKRGGHGVRALAPVPRVRQQPRLARLWGLMDWSTLGGARAVAPPSEEADLPTGHELLLTAIAPALRVEAGLLRAIRRALPGVDVGCEVEVWNHPQVRGSASTAICMDLEAAPGWQLRFAALPKELRDAVGRVLIEGHRHLPKPIRLAEALQLREAGVDVAAMDENLTDAAAFLQRAASTLEEEKPETSALGQQVDAYWLRFRERAASGLFRDPELRHTLARVERILRARYPEELEAAAGSSPQMLDGTELPRPWTVWQEGGRLRVRPRGETGRGSPLVDLKAARIQVEDGVGPVVEVDLDGARTVDWPRVGEFRLVTDAETLTVARCACPDWSSAWGRDRFGLWADLTIKGVVQRMRWMPPGRFWMGSPEEEAGRWDDEGPRHEVILTEGFWLADTPCTQELWEVVMGSNPSEFQSEKRPVETVSWEDAQKFLSQLEEERLKAILPSEAQWEYACRAGTSTATWLGELEILGKNNAPQLDELAWYGGNSGHGFDLEKGRGAGWSEKQYEFETAGSREVKLKIPNPWGLYDTLGNVFEWCEDWSQSQYESSLQVDPLGPEQGSNRVIRGGSWYSNARYVRAAFRHWRVPGYRDGRLGFRLALGGGLGRGAAVFDRGAVLGSERGALSGRGAASSGASSDSGNTEET